MTQPNHREDESQMDTPELTYVIDGDTVRFSDGATLPVVSGGDGEGDPGAGDGDAATPPAAPITPPAAPAGPVPAPGGPTGAPAVPPTPPAAGAEADPFDDPSTDSFPRPYVERLRSEAAARRTEAAAFKSAFEGYTPEDQAVLLDLAKTLRTDPASAAAWMQEQAQALLDADPDPAGGQDPADPDAPLTRAQLDAYLAERDQKAAAERAQADQLAKIAGEAKTLGFDPEAKVGQAARDYVALLHAANTETGGDLAKAAEVVRSERQKIVDDFLAAKAAGAGAATTPPQVGAGRETQPSVADLDWDDLGRTVRKEITARP